MSVELTHERTPRVWRPRTRSVALDSMLTEIKNTTTVEEVVVPRYRAKCCIAKLQDRHTDVSLPPPQGRFGHTRFFTVGKVKEFGCSLSQRKISPAYQPFLFAGPSAVGFVARVNNSGATRRGSFSASARLENALNSLGASSGPVQLLDKRGGS